MSYDPNDSTAAPIGFPGEGSDPVRGSLTESLEEALSAVGGHRTPGRIEAPESAIEFRVIRPGAPVRRLRLTGNRYTFGSGDGCSIRLEDPSLRPMHAVLLRDAHRILMRAYSVPLECNGARVTESVLRLGDIIRMGNYRFELLAAPGSVDPAASQFRASKPAGEKSLTTHLTELSQQWHARHAECEVRERRCDRRESELHGRETELWSRAQTLQQRENLLLAQEAAAREIQETYIAAQEELKALRGRDTASSEELQQREAELQQEAEQLEQRRMELERRQEEWKAREAQQTERAAEAQRKLEQTQQQADAASEAVNRMREEFASLNQQLSGLRERHSELQQREKREQEEHDRLRSELEATRDAALQARTESETQREEASRDLDRVQAELESTRGELNKLREESKACQDALNERLRATSEELQASREEAEQKRRQAEEEHAYAQNRVIELEERLVQVQEKRLKTESSQREKIAALEQANRDAESGRDDAEQIAEGLREDIDRLETSLAAAEEEASQLRIDHEAATASIRQLELLVDQTKNNQSAQQDSWSDESEQLQKTIEELSIQLAAANAELGELRAANEALANELSEAHRGGEAAGDQPQAIDSEQFQVLERELESAREEIERLQATHAETVARLNADREENESALRDEIESLREEIASAQQAAEKSLQAFTSSGQSSPGIAADWSSEFSGPSGGDDATSETDSAKPQDDARQSDAQRWDEQAGGEELSGEELSGEQPTIRQDGAVRRSTFGEDAPAGGDAQAESGVSWHDEPPEQAVSDAIDDIEHHLEQAGADPEPPADSPWGTAAPAVSSWQESPAEIEPSPSDSPEQAADAEATDAEATSAEATYEQTLVAESLFGDADRETTEAEQETRQEVSSDWSSFVSDQAGESATDESATDEGEPEAASADQIAAEQVEGTFDAAEAESGRGDVEGSDGWHIPSAEELSAESAEPPRELHEASDWGSSESGADRQAEEPESGYEATQQWSGLAESDEIESTIVGQAPAEDGGDDSGSLSAHEPSSLAAMLIRDFAAEEAAEKNDPSATESATQSESEESWSTDQANPESDVVEPEGTGSADAEPDSDEAVEPTFVIDSEIRFEEDEQQEELGAWNFHSPTDRGAESEAEADEVDDSLIGAEDSPLADASDAEPSEAIESESSQTALAPEHETLVASAGSEDDDSIEAYMSRLLQRVQGGTVSPAALTETTAPADSEVVEEKVSESLPAPAEDSTADSTPSDSSVAESAPLVPRSQAPELSRNLSAMRELANQSARNAVARSIRLQARDTQMKAVFKGLFSLAFVVMSAVVYIFLQWSITIKFAMVGAMLVLAGVVAQEAFVLARDAKRRLALAEASSGEVQDEAELADQIERIAKEVQAKEQKKAKERQAEQG